MVPQGPGAADSTVRNRAAGTAHAVASGSSTALGNMTPAAAPLAGKTAGVIGGGPAGMLCAAQLARLGARVQVFERTEGTAPSPAVWSISLGRCAKDAIEAAGLSSEFGPELRCACTCHMCTSYACGTAPRMCDIHTTPGQWTCKCCFAQIAIGGGVAWVCTACMWKLIAARLTPCAHVNGTRPRTSRTESLMTDDAVMLGRPEVAV